LNYVFGLLPVNEFDMTTFTSFLPDDLLKRLDEASKNLSLPKNRLIEKALNIYLDQLNRAEYIRSFKEAGKDQEIMSIAEEGMADYLANIDEDAAG